MVTNGKNDQIETVFVFMLSRKIKMIIPFLGLLIICLFSCRKYEDNPLINLSSKKSRLQGTYYLAAYKIDDVDITHSIKFDSSVTVQNFSFFIDQLKEPSLPPEIGGSYLNGKCVLMDRKKNIMFFLRKTCFKEGPLADYAGQKFRIRKLTENQLVLEIMFNEQKHTIYFFKS